jgi:hypothetical protein
MAGPNANSHEDQPRCGGRNVKHSIRNTQVGAHVRLPIIVIHRTYIMIVLTEITEPSK